MSNSSKPDSFPVTDPDYDAPDGAIVDGYERHGMTWEKVHYFPIMHGQQLRGLLWDEIKPHEQQAQRNHDQSLKMLASRGGLDPIELWCVVNDMCWREVIPLGTSHKQMQEISADCEKKLMDRFGDKLRHK